jgi:hypothetical protein
MVVNLLQRLSANATVLVSGAFFTFGIRRYVDQANASGFPVAIWFA